MKTTRGKVRGKRDGTPIAMKAPHRKATTFRFAPAVQKQLELLAKLKKAPLNRLVNTAVEQYVEVGLAEAEKSLKDLLHTVRAAREADPNFESAIADFVGAEAVLAAEDPVEGTRTPIGPADLEASSTTGPTRRKIHRVLRA